LGTWFCSARQFFKWPVGIIEGLIGLKIALDVTAEPYDKRE
jgi:hypothetical protein